MKSNLFHLSAMIALTLAIGSGPARAWQPGTYPKGSQSMSSRGFSVNTGDRNDVIAFWHAVYQASEGYEKRVGWTGNQSGKPGKTSKEFARDVERRLNYFRAMCGVSAKARVNDNSKIIVQPGDAHQAPRSARKADAAQAAAMMMILNYNSSTGQNPAFSHDPAASLAGWSEAAWNAQANGNLALGVYGPGAITAYLIDDLPTGAATSEWNTLVGHRRWSLLPRATSFGSGDQPGASAFVPPTNVLYVLQSERELKKGRAAGFVAYPAAGFFPAAINSRYWSLSREGADFSNAKVSVTDSKNKPVAISGVRSNSNHGDPALLWEVTGAAASNSVYQDASFNVSVTGIGGDRIPKSLNYTVTLINPDRVIWNKPIVGPVTISPAKAAIQGFDPPKGAEAITLSTFRRGPATWTETAEATSTAKVVDGTAENYPLIANMASYPEFGTISGDRAFRLTFPDTYDAIVRGVPEQSLEIDRDIIADKGARLDFSYRRGYMTTTSTLAVEVSTNGGLTWQTLGKPISGVSDNIFDKAASTASYPLPASDEPLRVRFRYFALPNTGIYTHEGAPSAPTGIFIDDITTAGCDWLEPRQTTTLPKNSKKFVLNDRTLGGKIVANEEYRLGLQVKLGGKWFQAGALKKVIVKP
jgi:hypothetical protein